MKIKNLKPEELDAMGYDDIAYLVIKETNKKTKIQPLFKKICDILNLPDEVFENQIADFFELISTDKRFIMINGDIDLKEYHSDKIKIEEDDSELIFDSIDDVEYEEDEEDIDEDSYDDGDEEDDLPDNDLKDLVIINEDDMASDEML